MPQGTMTDLQYTVYADLNEAAVECIRDWCAEHSEPDWPHLLRIMTQCAAVRDILEAGHEDSAALDALEAIQSSNDWARRTVDRWYMFAEAYNG